MPAAQADEPAGQPIKVVLLGGSGGSHRPAEMAELIVAPLARQGIDVRFTTDVGVLAPDSLAGVDCVAIYKDDGELPEANEKALLEFVESGRGLVAIHCASHCFRNSPRYGALVGGRFASHGRETFTTRILDAQHPAMSGLTAVTVDDETYVHNELTEDLRVLMGREDQGRYEPYAWVREQGRGRVYYTALGHDEKTWRQDAFHELIAQAIRWATGRLNDDAPANPIVDDKPGPLSPADSIKHMHLPEGFRVELFAAEPDVVKPLTMAFDERGRAWLVESADYPNDIFEPFAGHDRIKICEDTDADGRADKFTVFAEGLNIPTGLIPVAGGAIVALSPHIVFFQDTDGDDRADAHKILYTGFGRFDTHAVHSNFRWGPDNWIWATVGYSGGRVEEPDGQTRQFKQSIFRFKPDGSQLEVLTPTSNNTWGLGFNAAGIPFASTANNQHAVHLAIPNRYLEPVRGLTAIGSAGIEDHKFFHHLSEDLRQVDFHGGYTAAAGMTVLTSDTLPDYLRDRAALICEPTGHLVHVDFLVPQGAGFVARDGFNLLASTDPWCAPIETHVGPDGAVWMIDWYNYIVRHNPTPAGFETGAGNAYITPERDKSHGRIYRIVPAGVAPVASRLNEAGEVQLVAALSDGNSWRRYQAQRLLVERGGRDEAARGRIAALLAQRLNDPTTSPVGLTHALWTIAGIEAADELPAETLQKLAAHSNAAVRRAVAASLPAEGLAKLLSDDDSQVRLAALLAAADGESPALALAVNQAVADPRVTSDRWLALAATCAAARHAHEFLLHVAGTSTPIEGADAIVRQVAEHYARAATERQGRDPVELVLHLNGAAPANATALLAGLAAAWPNRQPPTVTDAQQESLAALLPRLNVDAQFHLLELARRWQLGEQFTKVAAQLRQSLLVALTDAATVPERRAEIAGQIVGMSGSESADDLAALAAVLIQVTPRADPALVKSLLAALAEAKHPGLGGLVCERWPSLTPSARQAAAGLLLRRAEWTAALLDALQAGSISAGDLAIDVTQRLGSHPDKRIAARARELLASTAAPVASDRDALLKELLPLADRPGDAQLGRAVFEKNCAKCHRLGDLGQAIGPDLTGINVRPKAAILTEILDPNRSVEGNFRQYTVTTTGGEVLAGLLVAETGTAIEILDSQAQRHQVAREDIDELAASNKSVMPEGFEKLPADELVNLLEFLGSRGKYLPLSLAKAANVVTTRGMFNDYGMDVERLIFDSWGSQSHAGVPFQVLDPRGETSPNAIELFSPLGGVSRTMPRSVSVNCGVSARSVHLLGGIGGWAWPLGQKDSVSMIVRLHYADGASEEHPLQNGVHIADYIRPVDVPGSQPAFQLRGQQLRFLSIAPRRREPIATIEFVKGDDQTAPVIMAVTVETGTE